MTPSTRCPRDKHYWLPYQVPRKKVVLGMKVVREFQGSDRDEHTDNYSFPAPHPQSRVWEFCHAQWAEEVGVIETAIEGMLLRN